MTEEIGLTLNIIYMAKMDQIYFVYGNQPLEIEEEVQRLVSVSLPQDVRKEAFYTFDTGDFFTKDQNQNARLLNELKNTCDTVSFFSPVILVHISNLQKLPPLKKEKQHLVKELSEISLVKLDKTSDSGWYDAETLTETQTSHYRVSGKQLVKSVQKSNQGIYSIQLDNTWANKRIAQKKGNESISITTQELLKRKLKQKIEFVDQFSVEDPVPKHSNDFIAMLMQLIDQPPSQVHLVFSANIKNTKELNKGVYSKLKKQSREIKKTIAYDDFRPVAWIIDRAKTKGLIFNRVTADFLIEIAGTEYSILDMELEKLALRGSTRAEISPEELLDSVSPSKQFTIFRISDFLAEKNLKSSLECLKILLDEQTGDRNNILALIASQYRRLLRISWMLNQGYPEKSIVEQTKINPWIAKRLIAKTRKYTSMELENIVIHLSKSDLKLKYSSKQTFSILENICHLICLDGLKKHQQIESHWLP